MASKQENREGRNRNHRFHRLHGFRRVGKCCSGELRCRDTPLIKVSARWFGSALRSESPSTERFFRLSSIRVICGLILLFRL
jgi:hypothetical protein